jgi:glycosyltransferase involved in cell wall biosynthesis
MVDISVVITAHAEGPFIGPTVRSALEAAAFAEAQQALTVEFVVVLDRANALTESIARRSFASGAAADVKFLPSDEGDPGQARNRGVETARGDCVAFLDGDDLWSFNWLASAWDLRRRRPDCVLHPALNVTFGEERNLYWHIDSEGPFFQPDYLSWTNYWTALSFARRDVYLANPFRKNDLRRGFGHEDWHWNCVTIERGIPHKPVPDTIHFVRRRLGSQLSLVDKADGTIWPLREK